MRAFCKWRVLENGSLRKLSVQDNEQENGNGVNFVRNGSSATVCSAKLICNQLVCDCKMRWIKGRRIPIEFYAKCAKPDSLAGKDLRSVGYEELIC
ncbi:hypothetical protein CEXT_243721 [Caerostris extrusa]|uniref:Uncharacterized protein n=1 Tax=Caerostris extrusa TaxID=172846 RepID=A0AAV4VIA5_CAEEX|nr:hypothetical protein CEXT_243721 [Caerostris extrusa]